LAAALFAATPAAAEDDWLKLTSPHFELYTTASEKKGAETIRYFEQVRAFFAQSAHKTPDATFPVRLVLFRSEKEYRPFRMNAGAVAYYLGGPDDDYVVIGDTASASYPVAV